MIKGPLLISALINSLFSPGTVSRIAESALVTVLFAFVVVEAEPAVVASKVGQSPARAAAADGGGPRALLGPLGTHLVLGQAEQGGLGSDQTNYQTRAETVIF